MIIDEKVCFRNGFLRVFYGYLFIPFFFRAFVVVHLSNRTAQVHRRVVVYVVKPRLRSSEAKVFAKPAIIPIVVTLFNIRTWENEGYIFNYTKVANDILDRNCNLADY